MWKKTYKQLQAQLFEANAHMELAQHNMNAHMERKPVVMVRLLKAVHATPVIAGRKRGRESEPPTPVVAGRTGCEPQCPEEYCFAERVKSTKLILDQLGRVITGPNGVVMALDNIGRNIDCMLRHLPDPDLPRKRGRVSEPPKTVDAGSS